MQLFKHQLLKTLNQKIPTFVMKIIQNMKNKAVILFLVKFFATYLIFGGLYQWYLSHNKQISPNQADYITKQVAYQTIDLGRFLGYSIQTEPNLDEASMKIILNGQYVARVVEGCNAMSVLILFWAFIIAFSGKWKETLIFGVIGSISIYLINLLRIFVLTYATYRYPQHTDFLHKIIFPGIIYGFTFLLWMVWVKRLESNKLK
mgnify:CR=1 FL=1